MNSNAIDLNAVEQAYERIRAIVVKTPILTSSILDDRVGGRVFIKAENLQRTGAFKFRGAMNRLLALSVEEKQRGVIAFSSGNHAIAIAEAARLVGCRAVIVMPSDAPRIKVSGVQSRGAKIVFYDRSREDREQVAAALVKEHGLLLVPPFDDPFVIAGQGTGALEAVEQLAADFSIHHIDQVIINCCGGGLASGWATVLKKAYPEIDIIIVEPTGFHDFARSLASGRWERNDRASGSICDALMVVTPGRLTLPILLQAKARAVDVSDDDVIEAMAFAASTLKLVLEPGGAASLAAVLAGKVDAAKRNSLIVSTGGNVDFAVFAAALQKFS